MSDKDWLEKIRIAYNFYPNKEDSIETFIKWLYDQYGIVFK